MTSSKENYCILSNPRTFSLNLEDTYKLPTMQILPDFLTAKLGRLESPRRDRLFLLVSLSTRQSLCEEEKKPVFTPQ